MIIPPYDGSIVLKATREACGPAPAAVPVAPPAASPKAAPKASPKPTPAAAPKASPKASPKQSPRLAPKTSPAKPPAPKPKTQVDIFNEDLMNQQQSRTERTLSQDIMDYEPSAGGTDENVDLNDLF